MFAYVGAVSGSAPSWRHYVKAAAEEAEAEGDGGLRLTCGTAEV